MPAKNRPLMLRLEPKQHELWLAAADGENIKLSEWIRRACDAALTERESVAEGYATSVLETSRPPTARSASADRTKNCLNARHHRKGSFCKLCMTMF